MKQIMINKATIAFIILTMLWVMALSMHQIAKIDARLHTLELVEAELHFRVLEIEALKKERAVWDRFTRADWIGLYDYINWEDVTLDFLTR